MCSAWELLLKAKWVFDHGEKEDSLFVEGDDGKPKVNRCGNPMTHAASYLAAKLHEDATSGVDKATHANLLALMEVRDNSAHFLNKTLALGQAVLEIGMASVQNYVQLSREWFQIDLSKYNFFLMPLSFYHGFESISTASVTPTDQQVSRLIAYFKSLEASVEDADIPAGRFIACRLETKLSRAKDVGAIEFRFTDDLSAPSISVREEDILKSYPWSYAELTKHLSNRYSDFLCNGVYHKHRKRIEGNKKYSIVRYLHPGNPKSAIVRLYNPNIMTQFDKHYTKRKRANKAPEPTTTAVTPRAVESFYE
jgi:hypothetical protein